jgi:ketosteroid isomerase-like protein
MNGLKNPPACLTEACVRTTFAPMEHSDAPSFLTNLAEILSFTAMGIHNPLQGCYTTKSELVSEGFGRIMDTEKPMSAKVQKVFVCGGWATEELKASAMTKGGLLYEHELCWIVRYEEGLIVEGRIYMDGSALLEKIIAE